MERMGNGSVASGYDAFGSVNGNMAGRSISAVEQAAAETTLGKSLGSFQFARKVELYRGSVSTVYRCILAGCGEPVVVKQYHKARMQPKHLHKLEREIATMRTLQQHARRTAAAPGAGGHGCGEAVQGDGEPGVVALLEVFEDPSSIYLLMECCEGGDLFKRLMLHGGRLPEQWVAVEVIAPLLRVLQRMHSLQLMHRDIKPENIFITAGGKTRLGDFGLAIDWSKELPFSRSGTLDYMAPEVLQNPATHMQESASVTPDVLQAKNIRPYTCAVDVWAVGCLAYELVCGRPPFEVEDEKQTASLIIYSNNIRFDTVAASPAWSNFVTQALIKDPRVRPTAAALLQHPWLQGSLQRAALGLSGSAATHPAAAAAVHVKQHRAVSSHESATALTASPIVPPAPMSAEEPHPPARLPSAGPAAASTSATGSLVSAAGSSHCSTGWTLSRTAHSSSSSSVIFEVQSAGASEASRGPSATQPGGPAPSERAKPSMPVSADGSWKPMPPPQHSQQGRQGRSSYSSLSQVQLRQLSSEPSFAQSSGVVASAAMMVPPAVPSIAPRACATPPPPQSQAAKALHAAHATASVPPQQRTGLPPRPHGAATAGITAPGNSSGGDGAGTGAGSTSGSAGGALRSLLDAFRAAAVGPGSAGSSSGGGGGGGGSSSNASFSQISLTVSSTTLASVSAGGSSTAATHQEQQREQLRPGPSEAGAPGLGSRSHPQRATTLPASSPSAATAAAAGHDGFDAAAMASGQGSERRGQGGASCFAVNSTGGASSASAASTAAVVGWRRNSPTSSPLRERHGVRPASGSAKAPFSGAEPAVGVIGPAPGVMAATSSPQRLQRPVTASLGNSSSRAAPCAASSGHGTAMQGQRASNRSNGASGTPAVSVANTTGGANVSASSLIASILRPLASISAAGGCSPTRSHGPREGQLSPPRALTPTRRGGASPQRQGPSPPRAVPPTRRGGASPQRQGPSPQRTAASPGRPRLSFSGAADPKSLPGLTAGTPHSSPYLQQQQQQQAQVHPPPLAQIKMQRQSPARAGSYAEDRNHGSMPAPLTHTKSHSHGQVLITATAAPEGRPPRPMVRAGSIPGEADGGQLPPWGDGTVVVHARKPARSLDRGHSTSGAANTTASTTGTSSISTNGSAAGGGIPACAPAPGARVAATVPASPYDSPAKMYGGRLDAYGLPPPTPGYASQQQQQQQGQGAGAGCAPPSPGPAAPGLLERVKMHLSRQGGV